MAEKRKFDVDWPHGHVTRDGCKARIICKDFKRGGTNFLGAAVLFSDGHENFYWYGLNGKLCGTSVSPNNLDLFNAPEPKQTMYIFLSKNSINGNWCLRDWSYSKEWLEETNSSESKIVSVEV